MLFGRIVGLLMILGGAVMLLVYHLEWVGFGFWGPGTTPWQTGDPPLDYMERSLTESFSAALHSGWTALTLITLGILAVWLCRHSVHRHH